MTTVLALVEQESWESFIARVGAKLSELEQHGSKMSWEKAQTVIDADLEADRRPEMDDLSLRQIRKRLNNDLRRFWADTKLLEVRASFMAHARKLYETWPEVGVDTNLNARLVPFDHYRQMAVCSLPREQKDALRAWAEEQHRTQAELRQEIRDRVDTFNGIHRPDFHLMTSNHWVINEEGREDGFSGGISPVVYANLIHHFSDPGDTILDPFAGGGLLDDTLQKYRHFREETVAPFSGPRVALMSDIAPQRPAIVQANARLGLPFQDTVAALAILDPPYLKLSEGKYQTLGDTEDAWQDDIRKVLAQVARCLTSDGAVAIMTDDIVRKSWHVPAGLLVLQVLIDEGWTLVTTIYDFNRNFLQMSAGEMARAKQTRLLVNAVKIIQVARRPIE